MPGVRVTPVWLTVASGVFTTDATWQVKTPISGTS